MIILRKLRLIYTIRKEGYSIGSTEKIDMQKVKNFCYFEKKVC